MPVPPAVAIRALAAALPDPQGLVLRPLAGETGLDRLVRSPHLQKTGLALAGFHEYLRAGRILILGESEVQFLASRSASERLAIAERLATADLPAIVATAGLVPATELLAACERTGLPVLGTETPTGTAMARLSARLDLLLAERVLVHGVLVDLLGLGVLILGESGIGKSECALELVSRGHRLVADDVVELRRRAESYVEGTGPEATRFFMEVRGLGLIDVQAIYGVSAVCPTKTVGLVVQLERWDRGHDHERLGLDDQWHDVAGVRVPLVRMPVGPGRSVATLVEVAARNELLKAQGYHGARAGGAPRRGAAGGAAMSKTRRTRLPSARGRFVVLTGLSGAGKSQAIRALEDLGYFCVDNLPTQLVPTLAALSRREGAVLPKVALVIDVREGGFLREFPRVWRSLKRTPGLDPMLIFLEASHETLVRRFSETRRPHPLAHGRPVVEGILAERRRLATIRAMADEIIDTTHLTVHQLRERFMRFAAAEGATRPLLVTLLSFGFKFGVPLDADIVFDVRFLPNPHFVPALKPKTGKDKPVVKFLMEQPLTQPFLDKLVDLLKFLLPEYVREGKAYLTIAIGCTGGRHRSVMVAEHLAKALAGADGVQLRVRHRDVEQPA